MARKSREKSTDSIYHIMCRSVSEFLLFRDDNDKDYYLDLLKKYVERYICSIYAYCLMDNHLHLHLNPNGFDISKFMHGLHTAYVRYYNKKYSRHGPVFADRFESRIINTDSYNFAVSAYIHNNPHDIDGYKGKEESYKYSSYGIYLGIKQDPRNLVDKSFMMKLFGVVDIKDFPKKYCEFVSHQRDVETLSMLKEKLSTSSSIYEFVNVRKPLARDLVPAKVISYISEKLMVTTPESSAAKTRPAFTDFRAFAAYALRVLCGLGYKEICQHIQNMTISGCSKLFVNGYQLIHKDTVFEDLFDNLACCKI